MGSEDSGGQHPEAIGNIPPTNRDEVAAKIGKAMRAEGDDDASAHQGIPTTGRQSAKEQDSISSDEHDGGTDELMNASVNGEDRLSMTARRSSASLSGPALRLTATATAPRPWPGDDAQIVPGVFYILPIQPKALINRGARRVKRSR